MSASAVPTKEKEKRKKERKEGRKPKLPPSFVLPILILVQTKSCKTIAGQKRLSIEKGLMLIKWAIHGENFRRRNESEQPSLNTTGITRQKCGILSEWMRRLAVPGFGLAPWGKLGAEHPSTDRKKGRGKLVSYLVRQLIFQALSTVKVTNWAQNPN